MKIEITDEMVTATARAAFEVEWGAGSFDKPETSEFERETYKIQARAALEAVAPIIADQVLERAAELVSQDHDRHSTDYLAATIRALKEPTP